MATRSSGSANISFSLITIPVKLYLAASSQAFAFNMITPDGNRVKQKLVDALDESKEVDRNSCVKGYEYEKDKYITLTDEELKALEGAKGGTVDISEFVEDAAFDPRLVEKCYYLAPDKGAERTYQLLSSTLRDMKRMAIAKWYSRGRDHLVSVRASQDGTLTLFQMYYANEVRPFEYALSSGLAPRPEELELAKQLIGKFCSDKLDLTKYHDQYAERIREMIERKRAGETFEIPKQVAAAPVMDLTKLLEASLAGLNAPAPVAAPAPSAPAVAPAVLDLGAAGTATAPATPESKGKGKKNKK